MLVQSGRHRACGSAGHSQPEINVSIKRIKMGLLMDYLSYKKETYDNSLDSLQSGAAERNWLEAESGFGEKQDAIDIDKSSAFLDVIFQDSGAGNFIYGGDGTRFDLEEMLVCIFSTDYLKEVCHFIDENNLTEEDRFFNYIKSKHEEPGDKARYYYNNFIKLYNFYKSCIGKENWVLGKLI
jgi:hypothetical protein